MVKLSRALLFLGLLMLAVGSVQAGDLLCDYCGKAISGKYYNIDGKVYHESCYLNNLAPRCAVCGEPLTGRFSMYEGKAYHDACFDLNVAPRCVHCGGIIRGEYYIDSWGNAFHKWHDKEYETCDFCGRLMSPMLTGGGETRSDGRHVCKLCAAEALTDIAQARQLFRDVCDTLALFGIDIDPDDVDLELLSAEDLAHKNGQHVGDAFGLAVHQYNSILGFTYTRNMTVYMLQGLPRWYFLSTVAHELMHCWLYGHGEMRGDPPMVEGSCNYASFLTLSRYSAPEARAQIENLERNPDSVYGDGYRRTAAFVAERGVPGWLDYLKEHRYFPAGY